jgi:MFS family permease
MPEEYSPSKAPASPKWVYSVLPASLATGPLSTLVQLYLIELNGQTLGTIYAGLAVALFNGVSIVAAIFWGFATDRLHSRKGLVVLSYGLVAAALFAFFYERSTSGAMLIYSAISFVSAASATPLNLLIMETEPKPGWAHAFARLSMMSGIGNVVGLIVSTLWAQGFPLILLSLPLGVFSLVSSLLAFLTIREPVLELERQTIVGRKPSFFTRLLELPMMFLTIPSASDFRRIFRGLRYSMTSFIPLFYLSTIFFYLASGVFNTSFVPALSAFALPPGEIFGVILAGMAVQTITFRYMRLFTEEGSLVSISLLGLALRGSCYILMGLVVLYASGYPLALSAFILYPIAAGIAFALYYTSSNTMMFNSVSTRSPGAALGVYSAVVGFATLAGSLVSGFISVYSGFDVTFVIGGLLLFAAAAMVARIRSVEPAES